MIVLFCPSRGRPEAATALLESFRETSTQAKLVFLLDDDDPTRDQYPGNVIVGPGTGDPTGPLNRCAVGFPAEIVGFIGDDSRCETKGWDIQVTQALRSPGFCWGNDGHEKPWPSTIFVSKEIVDALGYLSLPTLRRGFFDVVWVNLAARTDTARIVPAMFRHTNLPPGHPDGPTKETVDLDEAAFKVWQDTGFESDAKKVRSAVALAHFFP